MVGFDNDKYLKLQKEEILKRVKQFKNKLYIEVGGKLFDDNHAARVLPGFDKNAKVEVLKQLGNVEVLFVISAKDIEQGKTRSDISITYENDVLRQMDKLNKLDILANKIVITQYEKEPSVKVFKSKIEKRGIKVYVHTYTKGYPTDVDLIVSKEGYGANSFIETEMPIVLVTAPGPASGKLATCLSQIYHEHENGDLAGYAKFETFPVWNLSLKHPINLAYESATADLSDFNMIDSYHLEKYGIAATSYNRDFVVFPILKTILHKIYGKDIYESPTDMGVNVVGSCLVNEELITKSAYAEIIRRYYFELYKQKQGNDNIKSINKIEFIMSQASINTDLRVVIDESHKNFKKKKSLSTAIILNDNTVITGKTTDIMTSGASVILNAIKHLSSVKDDVHLISPLILDPIIKFKKDLFDNDDMLLNTHDILMALHISRATNPIIDEALKNLDSLYMSDAHASHIVNDTDIKTFKNLGINLTFDPIYFTNNLYE